MNHKTIKIILASLVVLYLALQFLGPNNQFALTPNFDTSCYSGSISFIEKVSENSSCGAGPEGSIGFPLVFNFKSNPPIANILVFVADMFPVFSLLLLITKIHNKKTLLNN